MHIEFRYFDGQQIVDMWDMNEMKCCRWRSKCESGSLRPTRVARAARLQYDVAGLADSAHEYRQTVYLPMSEAVQLRRGERHGRDIVKLVVDGFFIVEFDVIIG